MFSFHKPKVYRSSQGCCICKAKSSSSRFTDSKKYEMDFKACFQLREQRQGEICNACVLLVKRFKRLPPGNRRHWSHVVDARIGPGIKSMTKFKKRKEEQMQSQNGSSAEFAGQSSTNAQNIRNNSSMVERFGKIFKKKKTPTTTITTRSCDENSHPASPVSTTSSDNDDNRASDDALDRLDNLECDEEMCPIDDDVANQRAHRKQKRPIKNRNKMIASTTHVIDSGEWKQLKTCCGVFYENKKLGALLLETNQYSMGSCLIHAKKLPLTTTATATTSTNTNDLMKLPTVIKSLPPKKQHFLRQCIIETAPPAPIVQMPIEQSAPIDYSKSTAIDAARSSNHLHKIRNDASKVTKKTPKKKLAELNAAKNLLKLCTSNRQMAKATLLADANVTTPSIAIEQKYTEQTMVNDHNENKNITNTVSATEPTATPKYSDNSSDSGYEETLHDATQLNQIAKIGATRPIILSNGVKLHVKPENLVLAANLAGVSQTAIQTTQANMKAIHAQKHQKLNVTPPIVPASNYKCIVPPHVGDVNKQGVYMVAPTVLAVTNNS